MRLFSVVFICLFSSVVFAYDNFFGVSGVIESGGAVEGSARNYIDDNGVSGQLIDENGDIHSFEGKWIGNGQISGETDDGESVELHTDHSMS
jgi:hypothetical protein